MAHCFVGWGLLLDQVMTCYDHTRCLENGNEGDSPVVAFSSGRIMVADWALSKYIAQPKSPNILPIIMHHATKID